MALSRAMPTGNRPAYLDGLFNRNSSGNASVSSSISSSSTVSLSTSMSDLRSPSYQPRPLSPAFEDDSFSIRSKKSFLSSRSFKLSRLLQRRTYPQFDIQEINHSPAKPTSPTSSEESSPTKAQRTSFPKARGSSMHSKSPSIAPAPAAANELSCHRCYYFAARNCNGWVMGGASGDACETCLQAGFFGAK